MGWDICEFLHVKRAGGLCENGEETPGSSPSSPPPSGLVMEHSFLSLSPPLPSPPRGGNGVILPSFPGPLASPARSKIRELPTHPSHHSFSRRRTRPDPSFINPWTCAHLHFWSFARSGTYSCTSACALLHQPASSVPPPCPHQGPQEKEDLSTLREKRLTTTREKAFPPRRCSNQNQSPCSTVTDRSSTSPPYKIGGREQRNNGEEREGN